MTEIERILRRFDEIKRVTQDSLGDARRSESPLEEAQRSAQQSPFEEAQRELERIDEVKSTAQDSLFDKVARETQADIALLSENARADIRAAQTLSELEQKRVEYLGRSAQLTELKRRIRELPVELRPEIGGAANQASREIEAVREAREAELTVAEREERLRAEAVDVTLPGVPYPKGSLHPSMRIIDEVVDFFVGLGYRVAEGPEVDTDYYNFTALNIPPGHPARGMQDTFFLDEGLVLRTHTSPVQIRTMLSQEPPVYVVCPGRTYRRDSDPTHTPMFNQIEGLAVDKGLTLGHLKGTLAAMARHVFGEDVRVRLRPSYFQFVEPGVELDVSCFVCGGSDPNCKVCKGAGWIEMLGAGMVDPAVLTEVGYDPEEYTGFAFGMGPDRMAMVKYGVTDLRLFFEGDLRFLRQF
jgi:phenylalanyl-tRNA synthetase alpha chain